MGLRRGCRSRSDGVGLRGPAHRVQGYVSVQDLVLQNRERGVVKAPASRTSPSLNLMHEGCSRRCSINSGLESPGGPTWRAPRRPRADLAGCSWTDPGRESHPCGPARRRRHGSGRRRRMRPLRRYASGPSSEEAASHGRRCSPLRLVILVEAVSWPPKATMAVRRLELSNDPKLRKLRPVHERPRPRTAEPRPRRPPGMPSGVVDRSPLGRPAR